MKAIKKMGVALTVASALALPAGFAHADDDGKSKWVFDVCVNTAVDVALTDNGDGTPFTAGDIISAVGLLLPGGTIDPAAPDATCAAYVGSRIGTFFVKGQVIGGLPNAETDDLVYVDWHFRVNGRGAFDTTGPVKIVNVGESYPQTITGGTGRFRGVKGTAPTTALEAGGFLFRIALSNGD